MPKLTTYPEWNANIPNYPGHPLKELVPRMDNDALDLLGVSLVRENDVQKLLTYDPEKRIDCQQALNHPYFKDMNRQRR